MNLSLSSGFYLVAGLMGVGLILWLVILFRHPTLLSANEVVWSTKIRILALGANVGLIVSMVLFISKSEQPWSGDHVLALFDQFGGAMLIFLASSTIGSRANEVRVTMLALIAMGSWLLMLGFWRFPS